MSSLLRELKPWTGQDPQVRAVKPVVAISILLFILALFDGVEKVLLSVPFVLFESKLLGVMGIAGISLREAKECLRTERENLSAERDAFLKFAERVQSVSEGICYSDTITNRQVNTSKINDSSPQKIREQYRKTVFSLPELESKYNESLEEHIAAEFGPDVARVIMQGQTVTPKLKQLVIKQAKESAQRREQALEMIRREKRSIQSVRDELDNVEERLSQESETSFTSFSFDKLVDMYHEFETLQSDCDSLIQVRQSDIQSIARQFGSSEVGLFQEYLYCSHEVRYPALHAILSCRRLLDKQKSKICRVVSEGL